jgi:hypothetical protein
MAMKRSFVVFAALAALGLCTTGLIVPFGSSAAQQGTKSSQSIAADLLFAGPESADFRAGAGAGTSWLVNFVQKAQQAQGTASKCPIDVDVSVMAGLHPDYAKATAAQRRDIELVAGALHPARRDAIAGVLEGFGPSVRVNVNVTKGLARMVTISAQTAKDKEKPKLDTTSKPPKGTRVKAGQEIVVTMKARDDANAWQSGIKTVTLVADSEGDALIAGPTYPPAPAGCTGTPPEREVTATYKVPPNPPPIVRLTATAMDHVGLTDSDIGEFPTGDFYGTFRSESASRYFTRADIVLNHDGKGNLTGTMIGQQRTDFSWDNGRCFQRTIRPNNFRIALVGSYTEVQKGSTLKVFFKEIEETKILEETWCKGSSAAPNRLELGFKTRVWGTESFLGTPSPLGEGEVLADGTRQYKWEHPDGVTATVTLRRAEK